MPHSPFIDQCSVDIDVINHNLCLISLRIRDFSERFQQREVGLFEIVNLVGRSDNEQHGVSTDDLKVLKVDSHILLQFQHGNVPFFLPVVGYLRQTFWPHAIYDC